MPTFLERMKAKEEEQRRNREEIIKRQEEIEAEMEWQRSEDNFLVESLEGEETTIASLYSSGELTKGQPVQYDVPWPEDKNGVRTRPVTGMVAEDRHGVGHIAFGGKYYSTPSAFARAALYDAFASHTFAQEYLPEYEQLILNGWKLVHYRGLPLLKYRERNELKRQQRMLGQRTRYRCHGTGWRRVTQPARPKPAHIFEGPGAAASAAYVACCAAHEAQNIADDAEKIAVTAWRRVARATRRAAKAAVCASYFIDDLCEKCYEAIEDAIEKYDWTPGEKGVEESDDDEKESADENDNDDDESDDLSEDVEIDDDSNNNNMQGDMNEKKDADTEEDGDEDEAKEDEEEEREDEQHIKGSKGVTQHDGEEKAKEDVTDTYYWHVGTGAVDDIPPEIFREQPATEKAGTIMVEVQNATGVHRADLKGRYIEEEHAAASAGWPNWDGADLRRWVDAHVSQTPLTHTGQTVLRRTRVSEFVVERHKCNGTYISPQNMPMVGLPADDPLIQAPWAVQYRQDERQRKQQHERELEHD